MNRNMMTARMTARASCVMLTSFCSFIPISEAFSQTVYNSETAFGQVMKAVGKARKGRETFEESVVPTGMSFIMSDPLNMNSTNAAFPQGLRQENIAVFSHTNDNPRIVSPRGPNGLITFAGSGANPTPFVSDVVLANVPSDSLDIEFNSNDKTGVGLRIITGQPTANVIVSVFGLANNLVHQSVQSGNPSGTFFYGIAYPPRIRRINIRALDASGAPLREGADNIDMWRLPTPPCIADVDDGSGTGTPDGGVTIEDLLYYMSIFDAGSPAADIDDGSGTGTPDGGVTIEDLLYFLLRFDMGC